MTASNGVTTHHDNGSGRPAASGGAPHKPLNTWFSSQPTTIFEVMSKLALQHNSINLGQGFPDDEGPDSLKKQASAAFWDFSNQARAALD